MGLNDYFFLPEVAQFALIGLLTGVDPQVLGQRARVREGLFAHAASAQQFI